MSRETDRREAMDPAMTTGAGSGGERASVDTLTRDSQDPATVHGMRGGSWCPARGP
jgi:hypothetical protein